MRLTISSRLILQALTIAFAAIISLNLLVIFLRYEFSIENEIFNKAFKKLYVNNEQNLPSYFNVLLFLIASAIMGLIHRLEVESDRPRFKWLLLSLTFLFLSLDESASVHEFLVTFLPKYVGIGGTGILMNAWVTVYGLGVVLFAFYLAPSMTKLPGDLMKGMAISGAVYVGGAIGCEMLGSYIHSTEGTLNIRYALTATLEESLEMLGLILFIRCLLVYVRLEFKHTGLTVT
jgi:hypothetical protein